MTMKTNLMICLMAFSVALTGYLSCLIASNIRWGVGLVTAPAILPGLAFGLAIAAWLLHRGWINRGKAGGLAVGSAVAYFAAYWSTYYIVKLSADGMILPTGRLALFHAGMIGGLFGTALLIATLAAVSADFRRKDWKALFLIGTAAGGALCLAGIGATSGNSPGSLANPGDRSFIFIWQLFVSGYVGMLLLAAPGPSTPAERGRIALWAARAVLALLLVSFAQAAIGYSRRDKGKAVTISANQKSDGNATDWANKYRNAKFITRAEFLRKVGPVHLVLRQGSAVAECVPNLEEIVRTSASRHGFTLAPDSTDIEMVVDVDIDRSKITTTVDTLFGEREQEGYFMVCNIYVQVGFRMKVNCRRDDKFVQLNAYPSRTWHGYSGCMGDLANSATEYSKGFRYAVDEAFDLVEKIIDADDTDDEAAWKASLWPASRDAEFHKNFTSPMTGERGGSDRAFYGLTKFNTTVELFNDALRDFQASTLLQNWMSELTRNQYETDSSTATHIQHQFNSFVTKCGLLGGTKCYADFNAIRLWQNNVVFPFKGELRRGKVCIWSEVATAIALPRDHGNTARDLMNRSVRTAAKEFVLRR